MPEGSVNDLPCEVYSIHFAFPGSEAIPLRDHVTKSELGASPEWAMSLARNEPAAFVRGCRPELRVVFRKKSLNTEVFFGGADGDKANVEKQLVTLAFSDVTDLSEPVTFRFRQTLPDVIGVHAIRLNWYAENVGGSDSRLILGVSEHRIYTTWQRPTQNPGEKLYEWLYLQLVEWTCQWSTGLNDEKEICDAIIRNLPQSGLRYGIQGYTVDQMLNSRGGMCGGWYQMFQHMAHCQGVFVHRRSFYVACRTMPNGEEQWCAIVIRSGGLNQPAPTHPARTFHDNDSEFPIVKRVPISTQIEKRYVFWSKNGYLEDGHCINFLVHQGRLLLYDPSFSAGPFDLEMPMPEKNFASQSGMELASFNTQYLKNTVDYMLGSLYNGDPAIFYATARYPTEMLGMTVRTRCIPDTVLGGPDPLTFAWGP